MEQRMNEYVCNMCGHTTVVLETCIGVTPFEIGCDKCKDGSAFSKMGKNLTGKLPKYEFFKPATDEQIKKQLKWEFDTFHCTGLDASMFDRIVDTAFYQTREFIKAGGLLLKPIGKEL